MKHIDISKQICYYIIVAKKYKIHVKGGGAYESFRTAKKRQGGITTY